MTSKSYTVYGESASGIESPLEAYELDAAKTLARKLARIMAMYGRTGRMLVRAADGYMVYSVKVRGDVEVIADDSLGGDEALFVRGEYAYMPAVKGERDRYRRNKRIAADVGVTTAQVAEVADSLARTRNAEYAASLAAVTAPEPELFGLEPSLYGDAEIPSERDRRAADYTAE
jgi:hypothetical protein